MAPPSKGSIEPVGSYFKVRDCCVECMHRPRVLPPAAASTGAAQHSSLEGRPPPSLRAQVTYPHKDGAFELGLFATAEEGMRVSDVLMSEKNPAHVPNPALPPLRAPDRAPPCLPWVAVKEAVDSNDDPTQLDLNFALQR